MKPHWTDINIPNLRDATAIVTGASSGVGLEISRQLASHGAQVIMASRNLHRTQTAAQAIEVRHPGVQVEAHQLDLADLASVKIFSSMFLEKFPKLDILVNNAAVSGGPRRVTLDGFEANFQINYLSHFALTGLLLPALMKTASRVVSVSSDVASNGKINFEDLQSEYKYGFIAAYAQSKLANLLFAMELDRRCRKAAIGINSLTTNPGVTTSNLLRDKESDWGRRPTATERLLQFAQKILALPVERGALPALYQATEPSACSDEYVVGEKWPKRGYPTLGKMPSSALDTVAAGRLWSLSEHLTGVHFNLLRAHAAGAQ